MPWAASIWSYAETSLQERGSSALLAEMLEQNGFCVERGPGGLPSAVVATYGSGRRVIGFLAEFDALPGLSRRAQPQKAPRIAGAPGHGCGHKGMLVADKTLAFLAIDLRTQPKLLVRMQTEWQQKTADKAYGSPVPKDKNPPVPELDGVLRVKG